MSAEKIKANIQPVNRNWVVCSEEVFQIKVAMKLFMSKNFFTAKIKSSWGGEKNE